jgi:hypothetical protein
MSKRRRPVGLPPQIVLYLAAPITRKIAPGQSKAPLLVSLWGTG